MFINFFPENLDIYEMMWIRMLELDNIYNTAHAPCMLDN